MSDLFARHSKTPFPGHVHHDSKGKPFFVQKRRCGRCGGAGRAEQWAHTGFTCYDCGGVGHLGNESIKLYTADQIAKMDARAEVVAAKKRAKADAKAAEYRAEADARREDFIREYAQLLDLTTPHMDDSFVGDVMTKAREKARISQRAAETVVDAVARLEERAIKRAASRHVGKVGERLELSVVVDRVSSFVRPCFNAAWQSETVWIITMRDADLNAIVSKSVSFSAEKGERLTIKATVKEHSSYNDEAQTIVQRIKVKT